MQNENQIVSPPWKDPLRLNVGSGNKRIDPGYINIDAVALPNVDLVADITKLPYPDNCATEIFGCHCFEHLWRNQAPEVLADWRRVLKPGGKLILEMPCLDKVVIWLQRHEAPVNMTMWALYGDPSTHKSEADLHKWIWSVHELGEVLKGVGFRAITFMEPVYHQPARDFRVEAVK